MHDISWPLEELLTAWVSAMLYGMNIILTAVYVQVYLTRGPKGLGNRFLLAVSLVQFTLSTIHLAACLRATIDAFAIIDPVIQLAYITDESNPMHLLQTTAYLTNNLIADAVLAWRLYVVWGRRWWTCVPYIAFNLAFAVSGYTTTGKLINHHGASQLFAENIARWALATWSLSITIQVSATLLISLRLLFVYLEGRGFHQDRTLMSVMWVILESGAVLSTTTVFLLAFYVEQLAAGGVLVSMIGQLDTLVPTSIFVRVTMTSSFKNAPWSKPIPNHGALKSQELSTMNFTVVQASAETQISSLRDCPESGIV